MGNNNSGGYGDDYGYDNPTPERSLKGYKIIIIVLAIILVALSFLYYSQMNTLKKEYAVEKDTLTKHIVGLMQNYDELRTENDTIAYNLGVERGRADSLLQSLTKERSFSRAKIRQYEKEVGTLREVMRTYVHQIDSLNTLNTKLIKENIDFRTQVSSQRTRADEAEERADELSTKIRQGSVIRARDITLLALSNNDREVSRAGRATRLRVDFVLSANELAHPGNRAIYVRITGADGYVLANSSGAVFDYEGNKLTYSAMREVDYQNFDLGVSVFYNGAGITAGKYDIQVYMDGFLIGKTAIILR